MKTNVFTSMCVASMCAIALASCDERAEYKRMYDNESMYPFCKEYPDQCEASDTTYYADEFKNAYMCLTPEQRNEYKAFRERMQANEKAALEEYHQANSEATSMLQ